MGQPHLFTGIVPPRAAVDLGPGATWLRGWLSPDEQRGLAERCWLLMEGPAGGYVPVVRGGRRMRVRMVCLGRHWNPVTYSYESTRSDYDGAPVTPVPGDWVTRASRLAADAGLACDPDICLVSWYDAAGRMGLHQDKDERAESIAAGVPVISISLGDTARFLFGGLRRRDPVETVLLASGDVLVFGGPARLRYHGVSRIIPGSGPPDLGLQGRFNLTFRQY